jgi:hypothetical protein
MEAAPHDLNGKRDRKQVEDQNWRENSNRKQVEDQNWRENSNRKSENRPVAPPFNDSGISAESSGSQVPML